MFEVPKKGILQANYPVEQQNKYEGLVCCIIHYYSPEHQQTIEHQNTHFVNSAAVILNESFPRRL